MWCTRWYWWYDDDGGVVYYLCTVLYYGLAIDTERQKLYYTDSANNSGKVGELSTDGTNHRVLFSDVNSQPGALVLDSDNRWLALSQSPTCIVMNLMKSKRQQTN